MDDRRWLFKKVQIMSGDLQKVFMRGLISRIIDV